METILDHNPTTEEIGIIYYLLPEDFDSQYEYDEWFNDVKDFIKKNNQDEVNHSLAILYSIRKNNEKAFSYYNKMEDSDFKSDTIRFMNFVSHFEL